jgi:hypothetical protein
MPAVALVLAHVLEYFRIRRVCFDHVQRKRFGEGLRIVESHFQFQMTEIRAAVTLREPE